MLLHMTKSHSASFNALQGQGMKIVPLSNDAISSMTQR